ncbi:Zinc transporter zitB [Kluyvera cryocrescens]|uniref:Zinc transporter zitB n=1 Tax=Kluyvera cryocrescens TaxID=580 RepID=A0A485CMS7_KLUCR|nr:Zinc transporter zitB [Kluyvera cryocrescens]
MPHQHDSHTHAAPDNGNGRRLLLAFGVTAGFMVIEAIGGVISGSLALLADAGHMLTDSAALLFALLAVHFARRPPSVRHTFGWLRLTTLAAFVNAIALLFIIVLIVWEAVKRFYTPQPVAGVTMMVIAVAGTAGEHSGLLDTASRQRRKESKRASSGATRDGRSLRIRWRHYCGDSDHDHRLDAN